MFHVYSLKRTVAFVALCMAMLSVQAQLITVGSYNIRYNNNDDRALGNGWEKRCPRICAQVLWEHPDIFGAQEVLHGQLLDLKAGLSGYDCIGVGRDDGKKKGEYAAIFYDTQRLALVSQGHFWLNQTPDKPALGWDAACVRICTWGRFRHLQTGREFLFLNLHMDHVGVQARSESARLVMQRIDSMTVGGQMPAVLTGDFNVGQTDPLYTLFTESGMLKDCYTAAHIRFAENGTYNAFDSGGYTSHRIDHIFVTPATSVEAYAIRTDCYWQPDKNGTMQRSVISDHYPVFARIQL